MQILLMEDDPVLADILVDFLRETWNVDHAYDAQQVYALLEHTNYDIFIFDINVNGQNGLELLQELRDFNNVTPTIFITAYKDTHHLKEAFNLGANDYIKKPFELEELEARILNIKRLYNIETTHSIELDSHTFFHPDTKSIIRKGQNFSLGQKNTLLLLYFIQNKRRIISSTELLQNVWEYDTMPSEATLRSHIRDLREIIGKEKILTIRGEGYMYE